MGSERRQPHTDVITTSPSAVVSSRTHPSPSTPCVCVCVCAEDNTYPPGAVPCLEFLLLRNTRKQRRQPCCDDAPPDGVSAARMSARAALVVLNNEAGFGEVRQGFANG